MTKLEKILRNVAADLRKRGDVSMALMAEILADAEKKKNVVDNISKSVYDRPRSER